jgi:DNA recombination protein RmuC
LDNHILLQLAALGLGFVVGILLTWLFCHRSRLAALARLYREQEAQQLALQNQWMLREQSLQHEAGQARQQLDELKSVGAQQQQQLLQHAASLSETQQALAAAREKLFYLDEIKQQLRHTEQENSDLRSQQAELAARLEGERKSFTEQLALLREAKTELSKEFENIANKIFDNKQQQFSASSKTLLDTTLDPLKLQLGEFRRKVEDVYEKESAERNRLSGQVLELQKQAQKIGEDAVNLAQALKGNNKSQGNWGEVVLERLLEQSGLQKGREYDTQLSFSSDEGARRMPDVIVHLPEGKDLVIDAKVSLIDYEKYCSSNDDAERKQYLDQHVSSLRSHIKGLSIKDYEKLDGIKALDFVFIFIPIEAAFMLALQHEPNLYREAYDRHIILVSPTTLLATLRTVENIWRYEKQNKNAERIAKEAGALHDQFVLLLDALDSVNNYLGKTQDAYNTARSRLQTGRGNLLKRVNDIRRLGAKTKKVIDPQLLDSDDVGDEEYLLEDASEQLSEASQTGARLGNNPEALSSNTEELPNNTEEKAK